MIIMSDSALWCLLLISGVVALAASVEVSVAIPDAVPLLGEGPHWDEESKSLLYVDIMDASVHRWNSVTEKVDSIKLAGSVSFVIPKRSGGYMIGLNDTLSVLDWETGETTVVAEVDPSGETVLNDAKCDASGRLWAGTRSLESGTVNRGLLGSLETDGTFRVRFEPVSLSNGLAWTADAKTMYHIDTTANRIWAFDFDVVTGELSNRRIAIRLGLDTIVSLGFPDGCCIDAEDKLWVAFFGRGCLVRFDPETGEQLLIVDIPAVGVTSCAFGGPDYSELYVTSGIFETGGVWPGAVNQADLGGSVFKVTGHGVKGLPPAIFEA